MFATKIVVKFLIFLVPYRLAVAATTSVLVSGALYFLHPIAGLLSGVVCTIITSGKAVYEKKYHDFQDVTLGYMIRQLIDAKNLMVTSRNELAFIHNGQVTLLTNQTDDINEGTDADDAWESVPTQSAPAYRWSTSHCSSPMGGGGGGGLYKTDCQWREILRSTSRSLPLGIKNDLQMNFIFVQIVDKRSLWPRNFKISMTGKVSWLYN